MACSRAKASYERPISLAGGFLLAGERVTCTFTNSIVANDPFAAPQTLTGTSGTATGATAQASRELGEPNHAANNAGAKSIWYRWTAPASGTLTVDTFGSNYDTLLGVYTGTALNALTQVASNDDTSPGFQSRVQFAVTAGTTYRIAVDGWNGASGNVTLHWALA